MKIDKRYFDEGIECQSSCRILIEKSELETIVQRYYRELINKRKYVILRLLMDTSEGRLYSGWFIIRKEDLGIDNYYLFKYPYIPVNHKPTYDFAILTASYP